MDGQNLKGHGLSLSLGTQIPSGIQMPLIHNRNHNSCFDSFLGTNPSISGNGAYKSGSSSDECVRNSENFPPDLYRGDISLHGMSSVRSIVPNSKYLKAAQQLLDEVVDIRKAFKQPDMKNSTHEEDGPIENDRPSTNGVPNSQGSASNSSCELSHAEKQDLHTKLTKLLSMLDEFRQQKALQQLGMVQYAWRPQRGLPESSVLILRAWLFEHFLHSYPKDSDKIMLARETGLTRSQVSNWFINARVRLWKPMIEEMYKQENCDANMDSSSSSENATKVAKSNVKASNDMGDDSQHCQSSIANKIYSDGQAKDLISDQVLDTEFMASTGLASLQSGGHEGETEHRLVKQTEEQRRNFDDCGLFPDDTVVQSGGASERFMAVAPTCQMAEFGRFKSGTGVSITLGLQHCEGVNFLPSETHLSLVSMREDDIYNAAATSTIGAETAELECVGAENQQQRFSSPHLLHDFVV